MTERLDNADWKRRVLKALSSAQSRLADHGLSDLAYEAVGTDNPETIDTLLHVFSKGLDASLLQSFVNALGSVPFDTYCAAYARSLPDLLRTAPRWAVSLLDYPGFDLNDIHCQQLAAQIHSQDNGPTLLGQLSRLIEELGLSSEHPWSAFLRLPRPRPSTEHP